MSFTSLKWKAFYSKKAQNKQSKPTGTVKENIFQRLMYGLKHKLTVHNYTYLCKSKIKQ